MKYLLFALAICTFFLFAACANPGAGNDSRVKCPACGYEFDVETG